MNDAELMNMCSAYVPAASGSEAERHWYAAYTCAHHEKSVTRHLELRSMESFLPLYEKSSRWKDRQVKVQLPLFSGYVFVRMQLDEKLRVLQIPGVVSLVGFNRQPAPIADEEMRALQCGLNGTLLAEPWPFITVGQLVRVKSGPLRGLDGVLVRKKTVCRFVLSLQLIQRSVAVEVDAADLESVRQ
jgi:transcription antitermination factor NusG